MINLMKGAPSFAGILSYTEVTTGQKKEIKTPHFWGNAYIPNETEMISFLHKNGYRHIKNVKYVRVM
jgi:hypothetical protein